MLEREFTSLKHINSSTLTMVQKNSLNCISNQKDLKILSSDKNLGPIVVNRDDYVKAMMDRHLSNRSIYEIFTKKEDEDFISEASSAFIDYVPLKGNSANSNDMKYVMRCLDQDTWIPVMHGLGKSYKGKFFPPPYRPVVAIFGSQLHGIGRWVDTYLKELLSFCKTYIKNSDDMLRILRNVGLVFDDVFVTT